MSQKSDEELSRSGVHRVLAKELGPNWRRVRWFARQFTPTSLAALGVVASGAGTWILSLAHKVDNQQTRIVVLETQIVPDLKLGGRVGQLEADVGYLKGAVGQFDYGHAQQEAGRMTLHGKPLQPSERRR